MMASLSTKKYITDFLYHLSHNHSGITTHHKNHDIFLINKSQERSYTPLLVSEQHFFELCTLGQYQNQTGTNSQAENFQRISISFFLFGNIFERREDAFLCVARESVLKGITGLFSILKSDMFQFASVVRLLVQKLVQLQVD